MLNNIEHISNFFLREYRTHRLNESIKYFPAVLQYNVLCGVLTVKKAHILNLKAGHLIINLPYDEWFSLSFCATEDFQWAERNNLITIEEYLSLDVEDRRDLEDLFSDDGQEALSEGIISKETFLSIPNQDRKQLRLLFTYDARQAIKEGLITIERYLNIHTTQREKVSMLFSKQNRKFLHLGIVTIDDFLNFYETAENYLKKTYQNYIEIKKNHFAFFNLSKDINLLKKIPSSLQCFISCLACDKVSNNTSSIFLTGKKIFIRNYTNDAVDKNTQLNL